MDNQKLVKIVDLCKALVKRGSDEAWRLFKNGDFSQEFKKDHTLVTNADTKIEKMYREEIAIEYPDHDISGEEFGESQNKSDFRWYLDPIDGTTNFTMGVPVFGSMVACTYKGDVVASAVGAPGVESVYWAGMGMGAYRDDKILAVNKEVELGKTMVAVDRVAKSKNKDRLVKFMFDYQDNFYKMKYFGAVSVIASLVAEGALNGYIGFGSSPHDFVPVSLVVTEAGGVCLNGEGKVWKSEDDLLVLGNAVFAKKLVGMINNGV